MPNLDRDEYEARALEVEAGSYANYLIDRFAREYMGRANVPRSRRERAERLARLEELALSIALEGRS